MLAKKIFRLNGYSKYLVNKIIEKFGKQEEITSKNFKRKTAINKNKMILKLIILKFRILAKLHSKLKV